MKKVISLLSVITAFIFSGCSSSSKVSTPIKQTKIKNTETVKPKIIDNTPKWIYNPNKENYICSTGSVKISTNTKTMNKIASMKAKANISKEISIYIESQSKSSKSSNGQSKFNTNSTQQSTNMLRGVKVVDIYEDTKNSMFYLRACTLKI